jgi:heme oxygenase
MERMRDSTAELHASAERHPFQTAMVRGETSARDYAAWLGQMLLIHDALESRLAALRARRPELAPVVRDDLFQAGRLRADLRHLGVTTDTHRPLESTAGFVDWITRAAASAPAAMLGALYVLEGSKNGNRFIARAMKKRAAEGDASAVDAFGYLDPHGEAQRPLWLEFKQSMNALALEPAEADAMVAAARETFAAVTRLSEDLVQQSQATAQAG